MSKQRLADFPVERYKTHKPLPEAMQAVATTVFMPSVGDGNGVDSCIFNNSWIQ